MGEGLKAGRDAIGSYDDTYPFQKTASRASLAASYRPEELFAWRETRSGLLGSVSLSHRSVRSYRVWFRRHILYLEGRGRRVT